MKKELKNLEDALRDNNLCVPICWEGSFGKVDEESLQRLQNEFPNLSPKEIADKISNTLREAKKFKRYDSSVDRGNLSRH